MRPLARAYQPQSMPSGTSRRITAIRKTLLIEHETLAHKIIIIFQRIPQIFDGERFLGIYMQQQVAIGADYREVGESGNDGRIVRRELLHVMHL